MKRLRRTPAAVFVLCSVVSVQFGQALGKQLFSVVNPEGVVSLRLLITAMLVGIVVRPGRPRTSRELLLAAAFGTAIAGMNVVYLALEYVPVGVAATIQLMGPLAVAVAMSRSYLDVIWSLLATSGLTLFAFPSLVGDQGIPLLGLVLSAASAVSMAGYVLLSKRAGARSSDGRYLVWALIWAAALWCPFGIVSDTTTLIEPGVVLAGAAVAVLSAAVPYSLELIALRTLSPRVVGTLQSLEPAMGSITGLIVLGEMLTRLQFVAVASVSVASIASVSTARRNPHRTAAAPRQPDRPDRSSFDRPR